MSIIIQATLTKSYSDIADELEEDDPFRQHLGASVIGRHCAREVWYGWRWYTVVQHPAQRKRLFKRGHREEPIVLESLARAGISSNTIDQATGRQYRFVGYKGHEGGSGDGFLWNVPDVPVGLWTLFECKTHNDKSYKQVTQMNAHGYNTGLVEYKPEHYSQCQRYMHAWGLQYTLYAAVNKNDDAREFLLIPYIEEHARQVEDRARMIIDSDVPPQKISENPTYYKCSWCDHKQVCKGDAEPHITCRSCIYAKPVDNGVWTCLNPNHPCELSRELQLVGCANYKALL